MSATVHKTIVWFCMLITAALSVAADTPVEQPANAFKGLVPGKATEAEVEQILGAAPIEGYRYPVSGSTERTDRLYIRGGVLGSVSAATPDPRYLNREAIIDRLGEPEVRVRFETQEFLEYCRQGLRFICDDSGKTTGIIYFVPRSRRVPEDVPTAFDLRSPAAPANPATPPPGFRVGAAQLSIAPERFDNLTADAGQNPFHLEEDVFARAVVFDDGETRIAFVGADVFLIGPWDLKPVRDSLAKKGFPNVYVGMSHTHANVDLMGFYGYYPKEYAEHVAERIEASVLEAADNLVPIQSLRAGSVEMPLAGGRVIDLVQNWRDQGLFDPTVSLVQAVGTDGKVVANLIHLTCHPEVIKLDHKRGISPDFVGTLCDAVTAKLGGQTVFLNGALGGMVSPAVRSRDYAAAKEMGKRLAVFVENAAKDARPMSSYALWGHREAVEYPIESDLLNRFLSNAPKPLDYADGRMQTEMNVVWVGDAQFITVPGELLPQIGIEITAEMKGALRMIVGLGNDELGYLIPEYDFFEGEYEERTGPGVQGGKITREVGQALAVLEPPLN